MDSLSEEIDLLLDLIENLDGVKQPILYHPETDALQHSLQVFFIARSKSNDHSLVLAALLHDVGKSISLNGHAQLSVEMIKDFSFMNEKIIWLVRNHLRVSYYLSGEMKKQSKIDKLVNSKCFSSLLELRKFDLEGRNPSLQIKFQREEIKKYIISLVSNLKAEPSGSLDAETSAALTR